MSFNLLTDVTNQKISTAMPFAAACPPYIVHCMYVHTYIQLPPGPRCGGSSTAGRIIHGGADHPRRTRHGGHDTADTTRRVIPRDWSQTSFAPQHQSTTNGSVDLAS